MAGPQGYAEWICGSSKSAGNCAQTRADVPYNKLRDDATRAAGMFKVVQTAEDLLAHLEALNVGDEAELRILRGLGGRNPQDLTSRVRLGRR